MPGARARAIYGSLPRQGQAVAVHAAGWLQQRRQFGGDFERTLQAYLARDTLSSKEMAEFAAVRLRRQLTHARETVPYWREQFAAAGLEPAAVTGPCDLAALPILDKEDVVRLGERLHSRESGRGVTVAHTSGTTGAGLGVVTTWAAVREQWAVWWRHRIRHGIARGTWHALFTGHPVVGPGERKAPFGRVNGPGLQVIYSQYHFGPATADAYLDDLRRRELPWFHGYPSFLALVAGAALERGVALRPRWVTTGAESLMPWQKTIIAEAFGVRPVEHYGMTEAVANASECQRGFLHLDEDFAAMEFVSLGNGDHRIVGSNLSNPAMPLFRYDTGDVATLADGCDCGLPGRVIERVDGRREDLLELSDGSRVGRVDHLFKNLHWVAEAQVRQSVAGQCRILVVPRPGVPVDEAALRAECSRYFGPRLAVDIEGTDRLPRTGSGKLRLVVREPGEAQ